MLSGTILTASLMLSSTTISAESLPPRAIAYTTDISHEAFALVGDGSSPWLEREAGDARFALQALTETLDPATPIFVFRTGDDLLPSNALSVSYRVRGTPCDDRHYFMRLIAGTNEPCTRRGFEAHRQAFADDLTAAFAPFINQEIKGAKHSPLFEAIAYVSTAVRQENMTLRKLVMMSDAVMNSFVTYHPGADWLSKGPAQDRLFDDLEGRGLLPSLKGVTLIFTATGRPLVSAARDAGRYLTPEQNTALEAFWQAYAERTGAELVWLGSFDPSIFSSEQGL